MIAVGVFGLAFGSFANVVIYRFPRGESLSKPRSACPSCGTPIAWYDNVPVLSWLLLRARCRACGEGISARYPLVELVSAGLWVLAAMAFGQTWRTAGAIVLFYLLLLLAFIDWDTMRLPNPLVGLLAGTGAIGILLAQFTTIQMAPLTPGSGWLANPVIAAVCGSVLGGGISLGIAAAYAAVRKAEGFGMGDVKLLIALGPFLGPYVALVLFLGSLIGAVYGVVAARASEESFRVKVPFGPFLAIAAVVVAVWGPWMWRMYMTLITGG